MSNSTEWDKRYANPNYVYGTEPNNFLKQELSKLSAGKLLLPGEGEGRNALWAAKNNWEVTAADFSQMAKEKAMKLFAVNQVVVDYKVGDILNLNFNKQFDAIGLIFLHLPKDLKQLFANKMAQLLTPKGTLIMETFHPEQISRSSGGPKKLDLFVTPEELRVYYSMLNIVSIETQEVCLNEGTHHQGKAIVIRMVATKE
ncbi:MAG: class I SAM-dependent methyltransferase [Bacteroidales bacterium]|jgi:2-polyprenyl-3-methyl-5-hydroxy-6-metoxy-1,4-benzoquinol methylase|nr:class I SAM-dependent methyltransferase [Bacteroidales bacterium]MDY0198205.1 class I SAM-dependent methyltransferase [Tenuifilaceae bacterium]